MNIVGTLYVYAATCKHEGLNASMFPCISIAWVFCHNSANLDSYPWCLSPNLIGLLIKHGNIVSRWIKASQVQILSGCYVWGHKHTETPQSENPMRRCSL